MYNTQICKISAHNLKKVARLQGKTQPINRDYCLRMTLRQVERERMERGYVKSFMIQPGKGEKALDTPLVVPNAQHRSSSFQEPCHPGSLCWGPSGGLGSP